MNRRKVSSAESGFGGRKILIAIVITVGCAAILAAVLYFTQNKDVSADSSYRAIFLDNNQVYFAKIKNMGRKYVTITDVYYFGKDNSNSDADNIVLVKLGSEVHNPTDEMQILENHILYIEKLDEDSRVVRAIMEYKSK